MKDKETNWNELAEEYTKRDFPKNDWVYGYQPVLELLGDIKGKRILDYGCGSGKFSRVLAKKGAEVIAVDPNEKMLTLARAKDCSGIEYIKITENDISFVDNVDEAIAAYILCGRAQDETIVAILQNIHQKLNNDGGSFIALEPHPKNRIGQKSTCLEDMTKPVIDYWRPVEKYISLFQTSGFSIDKVLEPKDGSGNPHALIISGSKCRA